MQLLCITNRKVTECTEPSGPCQEYYSAGVEGTEQAGETVACKNAPLVCQDAHTVEIGAVNRGTGGMSL